MKGLIGILISAMLLMVSTAGCASSNLAEGDDTRVLQCTPDEEWTNMWLNYEGWTGADGIYSIPLDGKDRLSSATDKTKTLFLFSDTILGKCDPETGSYKGVKDMVKQSTALLTGNKPDPANREFIYGIHGKKVHTNLFFETYWMFDGLVVDGAVYALAYEIDSQMYPTQVDMVKIPLVNGEPDYKNYSVTAKTPLMYKDEAHQIVFGMGICDNTREAGVPKPDGFVYIYGYRDDLNTHSKELLVARVKKADFADTGKWRFFNNGEWIEGVENTNNSGSVIASRVSCEMSVTPLTNGVYKNKFMLVYEKDVIGGELQYAIGTNPYTFGKPVTFYKVPEPDQIPNAFTYNAKAHPHLSPEGYLLVSYNVNLQGRLPDTNGVYRPRFLRLDLNKFVE